MKLNMTRKVEILILAILVAAALLSIFWIATNLRLQPWLERLDWEHWNLTNEQRAEIEQLMAEMSTSGAKWPEIKAAIDAKINEWRIRPPPPGDIELFYVAKTAISSINLMLLICLVMVYIDLYRKTKSQFTIGLLIFSTVLFFYALTSNPLVHWSFGFNAFGLGPFAMLPDLFTCAALLVLLYLSVKY